MSERNFLIVDDVDFNIEFEEALVKKVCDKKGLNALIEHAKNVKEAISKIEQKEYHYLIVDMNLPDGTGADIAKAAKDKNPNAKIAALTIYPSKYRKYKSLFDLYLHKPIKAENYINKILSLMGE